MKSGCKVFFIMEIFLQSKKNSKFLLEQEIEKLAKITKFVNYQEYSCKFSSFVA